jgi:predicted Zn-dependent protease
MAFIGNNELFAMSFSQYTEFKNDNVVIIGTPEAEMIQRVGTKLVAAANKWVAAEGDPNYFRDYRWEFTLVQDNTLNAWCMPGGKVVFYTGILPVCLNEDGVAVVMGHEIAHAILNHGQQRMSGNILQQLGAIGVSLAFSGSSSETQALVMLAYGVGSQVGGTLPFSRSHESEADDIGLKLMAIAGYNPDEGAQLWQRMAAATGGGTPEILSTHPSNESRIQNLRRLAPEARQVAARF